MNNDYNDLIGMTIRHKTFGVGVISSVFNKEDTRYFFAKFIYYPNLMEFRMDLLGGWGGFFTDISEKIREKGMNFPPKPIRNLQPKNGGYGNSYDDDTNRDYDDDSYGELLEEANSDNWDNYYTEETGWFES